MQAESQRCEAAANIALIGDDDESDHSLDVESFRAYSSRKQEGRSLSQQEVRSLSQQQQNHEKQSYEKFVLRYRREQEID